MDRLMHLKTSELNHSSSSELGYETADEDSQMSLYYSINNNSLDKTIDSSMENSASENCVVNVVADVHSLGAPHHHDPKSTITNKSKHILGDALTANGLSETIMQSSASATTSAVTQNQIAVDSTVTVHENHILPMEIREDSSESTLEQFHHEIGPNLATNSMENSPNSVLVSIESTEIINSSEHTLSDASTSDGTSHVVMQPLPTTSADIIIENQIAMDCSDAVHESRALTIEIREDMSEQPSSMLVEYNSMAFQQQNSLPNGDIKSRRTLVTFRSPVVPSNFGMALKSINNDRRPVLSSWNSLSRRSIVPKPILKKSSIGDQPLRRSIRIAAATCVTSTTVIDVSKDCTQLRGRVSMPRKSLPRKSILGVSAATETSASNVCEICKKTFPIRSKLLTHKKLDHKEDRPQTVCKYCDRSFKKVVALSTHLKENCDKIPATIRKKILTDNYNKLNK